MLPRPVEAAWAEHRVRENAVTMCPLSWLIVRMP